MGPSSPNNNDQIKEQQKDSIKGIIEEILERKLSVLNSDEMLRKINSMEEERIKDKETIEHLRSKLTCQQDPQPPSSKKETDDIKRRLEKLESENKQLKEVQAENDKMKKEIETLRRNKKTYRKQMTNLRLKKKPKIKNKNETEENNNSYK